MFTSNRRRTRGINVTASALVAAGGALLAAPVWAAPPAASAGGSAPRCAPRLVMVELHSFPPKAAGGEAITSTGASAADARGIFNAETKRCDYYVVGSASAGVLKIAGAPKSGALCPTEVPVRATLEGQEADVTLRALLDREKAGRGGKVCSYGLMGPAVGTLDARAHPAAAPPAATPATPAAVAPAAPPAAAPTAAPAAPATPAAASAGSTCAPLKVSFVMNEFPKTTATGEPIISMGTYIMPTSGAHHAQTSACDYSTVANSLAGTLKITPEPKAAGACPAEVSVYATLDGKSTKVALPAKLGSDKAASGARFCYYNLTGPAPLGTVSPTGSTAAPAAPPSASAPAAAAPAAPSAAPAAPPSINGTFRFTCGKPGGCWSGNQCASTYWGVFSNHATTDAGPYGGHSLVLSIKDGVVTSVDGAFAKVADGKCRYNCDSLPNKADTLTAQTTYVGPVVPTVSGKIEAASVAQVVKFDLHVKPYFQGVPDSGVKNSNTTLEYEFRAQADPSGKIISVTHMVHRFAGGIFQRECIAQ